MSRPTRHLLRRGLSMMLILLAAISTWAQSPGDVRTSTAMRLAPADSAFFATSLRMKERLQKLSKTKAVQQIWNTPLVQAGWTEVTKTWHEKTGPFKEVLNQPENQQLLELLGEMVSEEFFIIGGANTPRFLTAMMAGYGGMQFAPLTALMQGQFGGDPQKLQLRGFLHGLMDSQKDLVTPELVLGFKIKDPKMATKQVARLEVLLNGLAMAVPQLTGNVKRQKLGDMSFATITLDGAKVPWDQIPWDHIEEENGEFTKLVDHLKKMKVTVCLGNYQEYLILSIGESMSIIEKMGQGKKLAELAEMAPLTKHLSKPITGVSYSSKKMNEMSGFTQKDADDLQETIKGLLEGADLPEELEKRIKQDLPELMKDLLTLIAHEPAASMSFSFETSRGEEAYNYRYSIDPRIDYSKPISLLNHVGSDPILAVLTRAVNKPQDWDLIVKWFKKGGGYIDDFLLPQLDKDTQDKFKKIQVAVYPLLKRFDQNTRNNLIPALADGQSGLVIDNKLSSTQWHKDMPVSKTPLPLPEPALILGVSDADKLKKAMAEYRAIFNDLLKALRDQEIAGEMPEFSWPEPETKRIDGASLYWYAFPDELQLDGRLMPTAALSSSVATLTVSNEHALRLLKATSMDRDAGPLSDSKRPLGSAAVFNMNALIDTATPWVDYALSMHELPEDMAKHQGDIKKIIQALKFIRGYSSATYTENGATVTHSEWLLRDID